MDSHDEDGPGSSTPTVDDETSILSDGENVPGPFMEDEEEDKPGSSIEFDYINTPGPSSLRI